MNRHFVILLSMMFFMVTGAAGQKKVSPNHYVIQFKDKANSPYSISKPEAYLSVKALKRRSKFNISITENDIPVNQSYLSELTKLGLKIVSTSKWMNHAVVYTTDTTLIDKAVKYPFVKPYKVAEKPKREVVTTTTNNAVNKTKAEKASDTLVKYGKGSNQIVMLNGHALHNRGFMGQGVTIAVLDAGFYYVNKLPSFDSLWANKQILGWYDFVDNDTSVWDADTHGMQVLSTIGANIPGEFIGTAPKANFYLFRTEQASSEYTIEEYNWLTAAEKADSLGVDMIHSSLGYNDFDDNVSSYSYKDMDGNTAISSIAADIATAKGILVVTSAGNEGGDVWKYITAPADADSVLTVGATDGRGNYTYFSSQGPTIDGRVKPNTMAQGSWTTVQGANGRITQSNGTSFSGPVIAGMTACLLQAHPNIPVMDIIRAIEQSGNYYNSPNGKMGYGVPNYLLAHLILSGAGAVLPSEKNPFVVYPNPFSNDLAIGIYDQNYLAETTYKAEIFDLLGNIQYTSRTQPENNNNKIFYFSNLQTLKNGVYIVRLEVNNKVFGQKIIKF